MSNEAMGHGGGVSIGTAAALYGLAPSTLRWWESEGVLPRTPRVNGRRVYDETELRRIGLAYLCCATGQMPLKHAAVVTSGRRNTEWQLTVAHHAEAIEATITRLRDAHSYLLHLLRCPADDIIEECPYLDDELAKHTPLGRDETSGPRDETSAAPHRCTVCTAPVTQPATGRPRKYCSRACQQRHYRENARRTR